VAGEQQDRRFLGEWRARLIVVRVYHLLPDGTVQKCAGPLEEASPSLGEGGPECDLLIRDAVHKGSGATPLLQDVRVNRHD